MQDALQNTTKTWERKPKLFQKRKEQRFSCFFRFRWSSQHEIDFIFQHQFFVDVLQSMLSIQPTSKLWNSERRVWRPQLLQVTELLSFEAKQPQLGGPEPTCESTNAGNLEHQNPNKAVTNVYKFFLQTHESFCCPILLLELLELGSVVKQTPPCLWKGSRKKSLSPGWNRLNITHVGGPTRSSRICPLVQPCNILMIRATSEV